jgi:hypothetical protein
MGDDMEWPRAIKQPSPREDAFKLSEKYAPNTGRGFKE